MEDVFPWFLSQSVCHLYIGSYWFLWVNFVFSYFAELFISCRSFPVEYYMSLMYTIMSTINKVTLTSLFSIYILWISFSCLNALAETPNTILSRYGESGHPGLVPDVSRIVLSFLPFKLLSVHLLQTTLMFWYVEVCPFIRGHFFSALAFYFFYVHF